MWSAWPRSAAVATPPPPALVDRVRTHRWMLSKRPMPRMFADKSSRMRPSLSMYPWTAATPKARASKSSATARTL
eukprot:15067611-Alexandrium_andersonii.AAC.1